MTFNVENIKVTASHKALAAYIKRETGKVVKPESIALVAALQTEYRRDPQVVAEREAAKRARDDKKREQLRKLEERMARLRAQLGGGSVEEEPEEAEVEEEPEEEEAFDEPEPEPVVESRKASSSKKTPANRKTSTGRKIQAVAEPDEGSFEADEEAFKAAGGVVTQSEDGWETSAEDGPDDDFFDDADGDDAEDF